MALAYQLLGLALILLGFLLLTLYFVGRMGRGKLEGKGFSVVLIGPIPIILKDGLRAAVIPLIILIVVFVLALFLLM